MAENIKKVVVPPEDIPEIDWFSEGYQIRYRIKTENKNLSSHWSPIYRVPVGDLELVEGDIFENFGERGQVILSVVWDDVLDFPSYDVYVAFRGGLTDPSEFEFDQDMFYFHGTTQNHNYSFGKRPGSTDVRVIIQPSTNIKKIKGKFIVFDSDSSLADES